MEKLQTNVKKSGDTHYRLTQNLVIGSELTINNVIFTCFGISS